MSQLISDHILRRTSHPWRTGDALPAHTLLGDPVLSRDPYTGRHRVGTTAQDEIVVYNGQPTSRRVTLFIREANGFRQVRQSWSAADGTYSFDYVVSGTYWVMAEDHLRQKTIVAADPVQAVPMP